MKRRCDTDSLRSGSLLLAVGAWLAGALVALQRAKYILNSH
jgi:hypothetical protein